jgi:hypothetical protein
MVQIPLSEPKTKGQNKIPKNTQNFFSNQETTKHGVPQGSIPGPLLFITHIKDLPPTINSLTDLMIFADDTSVIIPTENSDEFVQCQR